MPIGLGGAAVGPGGGGAVAGGGSFRPGGGGVGGTAGMLDILGCGASYRRK